MRAHLAGDIGKVLHICIDGFFTHTGVLACQCEVAS